MEMAGWLVLSHHLSSAQLLQLVVYRWPVKYFTTHYSFSFELFILIYIIYTFVDLRYSFVDFRPRQTIPLNVKLC